MPTSILPLPNPTQTQPPPRDFPTFLSAPGSAAAGPSIICWHLQRCEFLFFISSTISWEARGISSSKYNDSTEQLTNKCLISLGLRFHYGVWPLEMPVSHRNPKEYSGLTLPGTNFAARQNSLGSSRWALLILSVGLIFKWSWNLVIFGGALHQRVTPSIHIWPFTATCNSSSMESRDLFWTPKVSAFMCPEICTYTHEWIESKNLKDKTKAFRASCPTPWESLSRQFIQFIFSLCQVLPRAPFPSLASRCMSGLAVCLSVCFTVMKEERREDSLWEWGDQLICHRLPKEALTYRKRKALTVISDLAS